MIQDRPTIDVNENGTMRTPKTLHRMNWARKLAVVVLVLLFVGVVSAIHYVRSNPLVFNESLWQHAHCMKQAGLALSVNNMLSALAFLT
jgi:hypothetical protein